MKVKTKIRVEPIEVANRLEGLGVTSADVTESVFAAVAGRNSCTHNDPRSAPGWRSWADGNRRLRERLIEKGTDWEWNEDDNIPSVVNRKLRLKITLWNTDSGTGLTHCHPQPLHEKGSATSRAISPNQTMFKKLFESAENKVPIALPGGIICWFLCVYCEGDEVRAELSCPVKCERGYFKDFHERIIINLSGGDGRPGPTVRKLQPDDGGSDLEVPVSRKKAL